MPWPPTGYIDAPISLASQLAADSPPGVESEFSSTGQMFDPGTGMIVPGGVGEQDPLFGLLPGPDEERVKAPTPETSKARDLVIQYAREKIGMWYVWGGESDAEGGYDCSGLLYYAFKKAGVDMPRVSWSQAGRGKRVTVGELQPGDLVAWDHQPGDPGADHIALYIGNGQILEAARTGTKIRIRKLGKNEGAWGVKLDY